MFQVQYFVLIAYIVLSVTYKYSSEPLKDKNNATKNSYFMFFFLQKKSRLPPQPNPPSSSPLPSPAPEAGDQPARLSTRKRPLPSLPRSIKQWRRCSRSPPRPLSPGRGCPFWSLRGPGSVGVAGRVDSPGLPLTHR